jgi:hypothetical protein
MTRERLIKLARIGRMIPGGPTGELHERERLLEMLGIPRIFAPRAVFRRAVEGHKVSFRDLRERSTRRRAILWGGDSENVSS